MSGSKDLIPAGYGAFLQELKGRIQSAQVKAALSVNREMIHLYWEIGKLLVNRLEQARWGDAVLEQISRDLRHSFPDLMGFSRRNLYRMQQLFRTYRAESEVVPQLVAQIPWGHNIVLIEKVKDPAPRRWYIEQTVANGWSRHVLVHQIETDLYARQVEAPKSTNFAQTLSPPQSDLAQQVLKDPYVFDFLSLGQEARERDLERGLLERLKAFLLELGAGFAFMGSQYHLDVGGEDFYIDLLFYHHRLRCLVALDLKMGAFKPEYAGKMNFYLSALDDIVRHPDDAPSLGIILCKDKNQTIAEYALRDMGQPIGVSEYRMTHTLPGALADELPAPGELERLMEDEPDKEKK